MRRLVVVALLLAACVACSHENDGHRLITPARVAPHPFAAASAAVPPGFREVWCPDLRADGTGLTVRLVVPVATTSMQESDGACSWGHGFVSGVGVTIDPEQSLLTTRTHDLKGFEDAGGDDSVGDVRYRAGVPGFDGHTAEQLSMRVYNDGLPYWSTAIQAAGIKLSWSVPDGKPHRLDQLDTIRRSLAVVEGTTTTCPAWGRPGGAQVRFSPPKGQGWVEREGDHCVIYFDGSPTVLQRAIVDPTPTSIDRWAAQVRRNPGARQVRLERDVTKIDGESADRLTWVVVRTHETKNDEPAGTWRIVVTQSAHARVQWGQTPAWWRDHRATYDALVASVRVR